MDRNVRDDGKCWMSTSDHQATGVTCTYHYWAEILTDIEALGRLLRNPKHEYDQRNDEGIETTWVQVKWISTEADTMVQFGRISPMFDPMQTLIVLLERAIVDGPMISPEHKDLQKNLSRMQFQRASKLPRKGKIQEPDDQWI